MAFTYKKQLIKNKSAFFISASKTKSEGSHTPSDRDNQSINSLTLSAGENLPDVKPNKPIVAVENDIFNDAMAFSTTERASLEDSRRFYTGQEKKSKSVDTNETKNSRRLTKMPVCFQLEAIYQEQRLASLLSLRGTYE